MLDDHSGAQLCCLDHFLLLNSGLKISRVRSADTLERSIPLAARILCTWGTSIIAMRAPVGQSGWALLANLPWRQPSRLRSQSWAYPLAVVVSLDMISYLKLSGSSASRRPLDVSACGYKKKPRGAPVDPGNATSCEKL